MFKESTRGIVYFAFTEKPAHYKLPTTQTATTRIEKWVKFLSTESSQVDQQKGTFTKT